MPSSDFSPAWREEERLAALASYAILDTSPEEAFDDVVKLASQLLEAPIVAVNLIAEGRQWFKSELGLGVREMPLDDLAPDAEPQTQRDPLTILCEAPRAGASASGARSPGSGGS